MDIGEPERTIVVEPAEDLVPRAPGCDCGYGIEAVVDVDRALDCLDGTATGWWPLPLELSAPARQPLGT